MCENVWKKNHRFNCRNWKTRANFCRSLIFLPFFFRVNGDFTIDRNFKYIYWTFFVDDFVSSNIDIQTLYVTEPFTQCDESRSNSFDTLLFISWLHTPCGFIVDAHKLATQLHIRFHWQRLLYEWIIITSTKRRISVVKVE